MANGSDVLMALKKFLVLGAIAASTVIAQPAAHASLSQCLDNKVCVWGNNDYNSLLAAQIHGQSSWLDVFNDGAGENNQNDSWANKSSTHDGCGVDHVDGGGDRITFRRDDRDNDLAWFNSNFVSAMRTTGGC
jgi:hypothetical protein